MTETLVRSIDCDAVCAESSFPDFKFLKGFVGCCFRHAAFKVKEWNKTFFFYITLVLREYIVADLLHGVERGLQREVPQLLAIHVGLWV